MTDEQKKEVKAIATLLVKYLASNQLDSKKIIIGTNSVELIDYSSDRIISDNEIYRIKKDISLDQRTCLNCGSEQYVYCDDGSLVKYCQRCGLELKNSFSRI